MDPVQQNSRVDPQVGASSGSPHGVIAVDPATFLQVPEAEFARHLGYPHGVLPEGRSGELADEARDWFSRRTRPWYAAREVVITRLDEDLVTLETGTRFESPVLADRLRASRCHAILLLAVSAGSEVEQEITACWMDDRPDDSHALNAYAAAATEHLLLAASKELCATAEQRATTLIQHYSPGYDGWSIGEQSLVMDLLRSAHPDLDLALLDSGLLTPQKSMLAAFGITAHRELVPAAIVPCTTCSLADCSLRRLPFQRTPEEACPDPPEADAADKSPIEVPPPSHNGGYSFPIKALKRWSKNLLSLERDDDGRLKARFTYHGSTCSDGGIPLLFHYDVRLEPANGGHLIEAMSCAPDGEAPGYQETCSYQSNPGNAVSSYEEFKPLLGSPLASAVTWNPNRNPAGCLCSVANRNHKWLMALQTIHYALHAD